MTALKTRAQMQKTPVIPPGATVGSISTQGSLGSVGPAVPPGNPRTGQQAPTKYETEDYSAVPPNFISDVSEGRNWFSPLQPITPFGPMSGIRWAREWDYPVGANLEFVTPRMGLMARLRTMSQTWGVLRTIIETRKDQLIKVPWRIQVRDKPRQKSKYVDEMTEFFRRPDGKRRYGPWMRMILEDLFVIDAPTLYTGHRSMDGRPMYIEVLDGATMKVLIDDAGRIPDAPSPAYQQIIKGLPMVNFDESEIMYCPMRPRPEMPIYGYSPVEHIYLEISEAIQKTLYTLGFWKEGNLPDLIMSVPEGWTATQIASFQALFDSLLSGNLAQKSKVRFVPEGMKPYDVKNASGEGLSSTRDEVLVRLACFAFSISPMPFIKSMNRATAASASEQAAQEGLLPLMAWWKESIMDPIIQDEMGYDDVEFVWGSQLEIDQLKRSQIFVNYTKAALRTINEIRRDLGDPPVPGGDELLVYTNNGVMRLQDAITAGHQATMEMPEGGWLGSAHGPPPDKSPSGGGARGAGQDQGGTSANREKLAALEERVTALEEDTEFQAEKD